MKKNNLYIGLIYIAVGVTCLWFALKTENAMGSLLFGFFSAGVVAGLILIGKYFYWSSPKRKEIYEAKLEKEKINMRDELKENLRNRAGRMTYIITLLVVAISDIIFSIIGALGFLETKLLVLYLSILLIFMYAVGIVIFKKLLNKYQ